MGPMGGMRGFDISRMMAGKLSNQSTGYPMALQHDTALQPNEVGGPLVDLDGNAVGINIARAGRVKSFAIPAAEVKQMLKNVESGKLYFVKSQQELTVEVGKAERALQDAREAFEKAQKAREEAQRALEQAEVKVER